VLEALAALPDSGWTTHSVKRSGRYRRPQIHDEIVRLKGIDHPLRQIAIRNIGRDEPTLLITNDIATAAKDLFARYAERMIIENELDADISGLHLTRCPPGFPSTPVLIDAGFPELDVAVPWWGGRRLRFGFPPR